MNKSLAIAAGIASLVLTVPMTIPEAAKTRSPFADHEKWRKRSRKRKRK